MPKPSILISALVISASATASAGAPAFFPAQSHVRYLESTGFPNEIHFKVDTSVDRCPFGADIFWKSSDPDNTKLMYATLLTAYVSQSIVNIVYDPDTVGGPQTCTVTQVGIGSPN